jgi:hypothetical protein
MSLLRSALAAHEIHDTHEGDAPSILGLLTTVAAAAAVVRQQAQFDRECAECDAIVMSRPRGADVPRVEPKSIHSPSPPARVRWQAPIKKGTGPTKRFAER